MRPRGPTSSPRPRRDQPPMTDPRPARAPTAGASALRDALLARRRAGRSPSPHALVIGGGIGLGVFQFHYAAEGVSTFFLAGVIAGTTTSPSSPGGSRRLGLEPTVTETSSPEAGRQAAPRRPRRRPAGRRLGRRGGPRDPRIPGRLGGRRLPRRRRRGPSTTPPRRGRHRRPAPRSRSRSLSMSSRAPGPASRSRSTACFGWSATAGARHRPSGRPGGRTGRPAATGRRASTIRGPGSSRWRRSTDWAGADAGRRQGRLGDRSSRPGSGCGPRWPPIHEHVRTTGSGGGLLRDRLRAWPARGRRATGRSAPGRGRRALCRRRRPIERSAHGVGRARRARLWRKASRRSVGRERFRTCERPRTRREASPHSPRSAPPGTSSRRSARRCGTLPARRRTRPRA